MPAPMKLGSVLGGRYKVVSDVLATAEGDHVLEGQDQILGRRVSILLPAERHTSLLVENARSMANGSIGAPFQILDLGQAEAHTYLVTSHTPAADMLDSLLVEPDEVEDESLSDDIFGAPRGNGSGSYVYEEPDPTSPAPVVATEASDDLGGAAPQPKVTRWRDDDSYDDAAPAPSVRTRLGRPVRVSATSTRSTLFDRAAASGTAASAVRTAGTDIDPGYDGDNRYDGYDSPEDGGLDTAPRPEGTAPAAPPRKEQAAPQTRKGGSGLLLLLLLLLALLIGAVVFSFDRLGGLFAGADAPEPAVSAPAAEEGGEEEAPPSPEPEAPAADPEPRAVTRVVPTDPGFMADQDAQLGQTIDGNPSTYWISYGFSDQNFGNQTPSVGLAVQLEEPAPVETLRLDQSSGSGGMFDVYVNDAPSLDGAEQVASGSFTGPEITVPLSAAARDGEHEYVIVNWTQLPQLTNPIAGFNHGLRVGEIQLD
ncbi:hypothetical protein [uncultured Kocuria sp.]|uniref:hypothetical protein n=1 Tax=uncultured Kocuria sp. TaxID=259305 RepID=UPI00261A0ECD|nr:hypothetical protein [uncultured Kocuria sp.]